MGRRRLGCRLVRVAEMMQVGGGDECRACMARRGRGLALLASG